MFGNVRGGNYGRVGKALANDQLDLHEINMANSPDYGKIAQESIKGRSRERKAVTDAEARIHRIGLDASAYKEVKGIQADADKRVEEIKKPARRMAGVVGAAGTLAGAWMLKKGNDEMKELNEKRDAATAEFRRETIAAIDRSKPGPREPLPKPPVYEVPDLKPIPGSGGGVESLSSDSSPTGSTASGAIRVQPLEMYNYATKVKGLSPAHAKALVASGIGESSLLTFNPGDNGMSDGIWQWHKERLTKMKQNVPDWRTNWKGQLDYALTEDYGPEWTQTQWADAYAANDAWVRKWERTAHPDSDVQKRAGYIKGFQF